MVISYNVDDSLIKAKRSLRDSEEITAIRDFLESTNESMCFTYDDLETARKERNNIATSCRKKGIRIRVLLRENKVVIVRRPAK